MSSEVLLSLEDVAKTYPVDRQPTRELLGHLLGRPAAGRHRHALHPLSFEVRRGESVGIVGLNGAGKSTLLQLASGVIQPSSGRVSLKGRVAALLELGSGFNPEASGWDNIHLYAATLGLSRAQIDERRESIIDFSGLREFIHAPVKTYSTGMQVRLAFSVATAVDPDLLIVDEALSVGDGVFAKRSFDRILQLRERGTALLLCSHALFHVDLFCQRTLWLHGGRIRAWGETRQVLPAYQEFLDQSSQPAPAPTPGATDASAGAAPTAASAPAPAAIPAGSLGQPLAPADQAELARLLRATVTVDGQGGAELPVLAGQSSLRVVFEVQASPGEPSPRAAVVLSSESGRIIGSTLAPAGCFTRQDEAWRGRIVFDWPALPLNQGRYRVGVYLLCAQGRYVYAWSDPHVHLNVSHEGPHQGPWLLPGQWAAADAA